MARAITDCDQSLAIVACSKTDNILYGRYKKNVVSVRNSRELSLETLTQHINKARVSTGSDKFIIVPISEYFNTFLLRHRHFIEEDYNCVIPLADADIYRRMTNKITSAAFFSSHAINIPREIEHVDESCIPFVAKPKENLKDGVSLYPFLVENNQDLKEFFLSESSEFYFFQQFIKGRSYYLLAYISRGGSVFQSSQENLAQQPNGKSILIARTSDFHHSDTAKHALTALLNTGFTGFVMLEFIAGDCGDYFIELNPRPWGPLDLCINHPCGIVDAFIGDMVFDNPYKFEARWQGKPVSANYLWLGGIIKSLRQHGYFDHRNMSGMESCAEVLRSLHGDVYLRKDSWMVFIKELFE